MQKPIHHIIQCAIAVAVLFGLVIIGFRFFGYYLDPDATSYLGITKAYLRGDMEQAVNGLWSPMGSWLTALASTTNDYRLFANAIAVNAIGAAGTMLSGYYLFLKLKPQRLAQWLFLTAMIIFLSYAIYIQSFTDQYSFFFINIGLLLLLRKKLFTQPFTWVLIGIFGALAYFSKAYSFYFYPAMVMLVVYIRWRGNDSVSIKRAITLVIIAGIVMLLSSMPWIYLLHEKYGIWTASLAGKMNTSWFLMGHPIFSEDIKVLLPPRYPHSLYEFEDPWWIQGELFSFWQSPTLFAKQIARVGYNVLAWPEACSYISAFYFPLWLFNIYIMLKRWSQQTTFIKSCIVLFILYPLPFYLISFDGGRYLWYTLPLAMILGFHYIQLYLQPLLESKYSMALQIIFFASFVFYPIKDLKTMYKVGKEDYAVAQQLKELGIQGSFVPNESLDGPSIHSLLRISYYSNNPIYGRVFDGFSLQEILADAERYKVKYYFYFYSVENKDFELKSNNYIYPELTQGKIPGLKVFDLNKK